MPLAPGDWVNQNVQLVRPLGRGGMGTVWVGRDMRFDTEVAVKFISAKALAADADLLTRFKREAKAAAQVKSPYVVHIFDHGQTADGTPYIVMELLEGESLKERLARRGKITPREAAIVVAQVSKALAAAHRFGVVHRDIKPDNVFLVASPEEELFVKVLDFGIAKQPGLPQQVEQGLTGTGRLLGTPHYMSPEQILSSKGVDFRCDMWSLAVVAYRMLTGKLPFVGETTGAIIMAIGSIHYEPPSTHGADPVFDPWFARAFARAAEERFATPAEMARAFARLAGVEGLAPRESMRDLSEAARQALAARPQAAPTLTAATPGAVGAVSMAGPVTWHEMASAVPDTVADDAPTTGSGARADAATPAPTPTLGGTGTTLGTSGGAGRARRVWLAVGAGCLLAAGGLALLMMRSPGTAAVSDATAAPSGSATARPAASARIEAPVPDGFVVVGAGSYAVGCEPIAAVGCAEDARPLHEVALGRFAIMQHEVKMEAYDICVAAGDCPKAGRDPGCTWQRDDREQHPINCVDALAADAYCRYRGWRLPTEAEWEAAARGPVRSPFPWGGDAPGCARTVMRDGKDPPCDGRGVARVGSQPLDRSWAGALDLGGNVREWTASAYEPYPGSRSFGVASGRVVRGGSYRMGTRELPPSHARHAEPETTTSPDLGFRCALSL
jgi:serine/threonine-protein kinase